MRAGIFNGVLAVGVVVALAVPVAHAGAGHRPGAGAVTGTATTTAAADRPTRTTRGVTALPGGRWSTLPAAPIAGRRPDVAVWTGTSMLVWGGTSSTGSRDYADGATYDPTTRTWAALPRSPLSARASTAWVWTGRALFVWGGTDSTGHRLSDGALYTPSTRRWVKLPPALVPAHSTAQAVWNGRQVVLLSTPPGSKWHHITTQAYDPSADRWRTLPTLHLRANHDGMVLAAVAAGSRVYAWSEWSYSIRTPDGGYEGTSGIDGYTLTPGPATTLATATWSANAFTWRGHDLVDGPLWTGRQILLPASQLWCGFCPGPYQANSTGARLDPVTGSDRAIPHGPGDDQNGQYVWTGSVLLVANTQATLTGGGHDVYPGQVAYWRPSTNRWTLLPPAPLAGAGAVVWTGHRLLIWGLLAPTRHQESLRTGGLELS